MSTQVDGRVFNFSAGPAALPLSVLEQVQRDLLSLPGVGASILEISHRSAAFREIHEAAKRDLIDLLGVPDTHEIVFLQGGSRLQFSMVPINLLRGRDQAANYIVSGSWGAKAIVEARREGDVHEAWSGKSVNFDRLPEPSEVDLRDDAAYTYITSNETIQGVQFHEDPDLGPAPLVCDASSDFLHRPIDVSRYGLIYACAQKNAGPAGVTVVIVHKDLLERSDPNLHGYLSYAEHVKNDSMYNTPPTFGVYVMGLVAAWLKNEIGGLDAMHQRNQEKAALLYEAIDSSDGFYQGHAQPNCRSLMNVTFRLPSDELTKAFLTEAKTQSLDALGGHRSVGGIRASIYNAMPREGVETLRDFMQQFCAQNR